MGVKRASYVTSKSLVHNTPFVFRGFFSEYVFQTWCDLLMMVYTNHAASGYYEFAYDVRISTVGIGVFLFMLDATSLLDGESVSELDTSLAGENRSCCLRS
jgi:hypothetical protein